MREHLRALNTRETKAILALLDSQWGHAQKLPFALLQSSSERLYLISPDFGTVDPQAINIDAAGLYFGELRHGELRLSIEGSQLIGPHSSRNVVTVDQAQMRSWLKGNDLGWQGDAHGFVLLKHGTDFLGCGKYKPDDKKILNFVPKARRITATD